MTEKPVMLAATSALKTQGNDLFNKKRFALAICKYDLALMVMPNPMLEDPDVEDLETKQLLVVLYSNKAEALLKLGAFALAKLACECALHYDPHHTKSLHRKKRAAEAERLHEGNLAVFLKYTKEFSEVVAVDEFDKKIEHISDMTKFAKEKMGGLRHINCLSLCASVYCSQFMVTGCREYLEPADRFAQNCLELCETFTCAEKRFEIDPKTTDPKYSLAELLIARAECSMVVARITTCLTGDRSAAATKMEAVASELSDVSEMASQYGSIAFEVAEKKLEAFSMIVMLETVSQRWTKAKTAAQKVVSIFKEQSTTEEFVHKHAATLMDTADFIIKGPDCNRDVLCSLFYILADGYCQHDRYEDAAHVIRQLINTRRASWGFCSPSQAPLPPNESEKKQDEDDTKTLLSLIEKTGRVPGSSCSICMEPLHSDVIAATDCLHIFHFCCISTWLNNNRKAVRREGEERVLFTSECPNCRASIEINVKVK